MDQVDTPIFLEFAREDESTSRWVVVRAFGFGQCAFEAASEEELLRLQDEEPGTPDEGLGITTQRISLDT